MVRIATLQGVVFMFARFEAIQRVAVSLAAALILTTVLASTAVSVTPIA